jgi:putative flippase GtrA
MRLPRFVLVSGVCALLSNVLVISFAQVGLGYIAASLLAFGPVLLVGYALHSLVTFGTPVSQLSFIRYTLAMAANFPLWIGLLFVFCDVFKVAVAIAAPATTLLIFLWNYLSAKWAFLSPATSIPPTVQIDV